MCNPLHIAARWWARGCPSGLPQEQTREALPRHTASGRARSSEVGENPYPSSDAATWRVVNGALRPALRSSPSCAG